MAEFPPDSERTSDLPADSGGRDLVGAVIGRYRVDSCLGAGGMGEVFRAWDTLLQRWVALKRLLPGFTTDERSRQLLLKEARAASALHHHAIVAIHDVFEFEDEPFIVEELIEGVRLRSRIGKPFDLPLFLRFAEECAEALVAAAEHGIVHCDLKPENILLTSDGHPKILDFGIARRTAPESGGQSMETETVAADGHRPLMGTPGYLAPEVIAGCVPSARSDLFSMGIVFYEMLTGLNPFKAAIREETNTNILTVHPAPPSEVNPDVPAVLNEVVARLLAKDPRDRYATPADLRDEIRRVREGARAPAKRPGLRLALVALAALTLAAFVAIRFVVRPDGGGTSHYLAIVPFKNLSDDPKVEFFSSGLTEALRVRLAALEGIYVVDAASPYGVDLTLEGGLQRSEDRVRISYRIVESDKALTIGSGLVDGDVREIFKLQDDVLDRVSRALEDRYQLGSELTAAPRPTGDAAAYDLYLQARGYLADSDDPRNIEMATALFTGALARDPGFALAKAGLAEAHWKRYEATRDSTWIGKALEAARAAVSTGPKVAEARVTLASILVGTGRIESAAEEYRRATELDPRADAGYRGLAKSEERLGRLDAAEGTLKRAISARPEDWATHNALGGLYYRHDRLEEALACFRQVVALAPDSARGYSNLGAIYQKVGRADEALAAYERSLEIKPYHPAYSNLATLLYSQGRFEEAARNYEKSLALNGSDYKIWAGLSDTYFRLPGREKSADSAGERAIALIEQQLVTQPDDALLLVVLSQLYGHRGQAEDARRFVERALALAPEQVEILFNAVLTFEILDERAAALETLEKAIRWGVTVEDVKQEPGLARLVEDPEFQRLVRSVEAGNRQEAR